MEIIKNHMNVLSLFDGMSCGQIALNKLGIQYNKYYAAEIDPYAIKITKKNYPNTIHLGDVTKLKATDLEPIDLLMGGSPCQGFSFAGKQLNFNDPRSALFFEYVRLLDECKPKYFLLENVRMKKEYQEVISKYLGVKPILINSALVSAQSRNRLYWTNIPNVTQPEDKKLVIKDVLEDLPFDEHPKWLDGYYGGRTRGSMVSSIDDAKANCLVAGMYKGQIPLYVKRPENIVEKKNYWQFDESGKGYNSQQYRIRKLDKPSNSLAYSISSVPNVKCGAYRGRYDEEGKTQQKLEVRKDDKTNTLTTVQKDNVLTQDTMFYRRLTPLECERLQTVPDNYTEGVSKTQRYKMLGNGWTVDVIAHILGGIQ